MSRNRTTAEKVADWYAAYNAVRAEITPEPLRTMMTTLQGGMGETPSAEESIELLRSSLALARLICANDRAAALTAAMLTSSGGVSRPVFDTEGDAE